MNLYAKTFLVFLSLLFTFMIMITFIVLFGNPFIVVSPLIIWGVIIHKVKQKNEVNFKTEKKIQRGIIQLKPGELTLKYALFTIMNMVLVITILYWFAQLFVITD